MKNILLTLVIVIVFSACEKRNNKKPENLNRENLTESEIDSVLNEYKFSYHEPVTIDSTDIIMIPIGTQIYRGRKSFRYESDSYDNYSYSKYWNFFFNNPIDKSTTLLTNKKCFITNFSANLKGVSKIASNSIFYEMADIDYNKDDNLDFEDPEHLFMSNNDGTNLRRVSPENESLIKWRVIPNTDKIIINTKRDINKDLEFDVEDDEIFYLVNLKNLEAKTEIINSENRNNIEQLYFDLWLSTNILKND